jgi:5'-deoxynucleotidase YfbR-like HD superfamily hydrolase
MKNTRGWSDSLFRIVQTRAGGAVERCHGVTHIGEYSNAKHSWGVAMLMWELWPGDFPRLAAHCLAHDVPEAWVGDIPAATKRYIPGLSKTLATLENRILEELWLPTEAEMDPLDRQKLKCCDSLELYIWCAEQMTMGNMLALDVFEQLDIFFEQRPLLSEAEKLRREIEIFHACLLPRQVGVVEELS